MSSRGVQLKEGVQKEDVEGRQGGDRETEEEKRIRENRRDSVNRSRAKKRKAVEETAERVKQLRKENSAIECRVSVHQQVRPAVFVTKQQYSPLILCFRSSTSFVRSSALTPGNSPVTSYNISQF